MKLRTKFALGVSAVVMLYVVGFTAMVIYAYQSTIHDQLVVLHGTLEERGELERCRRAPVSWSYDHVMFGQVISQERAEEIGLRVVGPEGMRVRRVRAPGDSKWHLALVSRHGEGGCSSLVVRGAPFDFRTNQRGRGLLVVRFGLGLLVVVVILGGLVWPLIRRVLRMSSQARRVIHDGFDGEVEVGSSDELGELATVFNLASSLAKERLKEKTEQQKRLRETVAMLSHDLRTPLATMKLSAGRAGQAQDQEQWRVIRANIEHMEAMLSNFSSMVQLRENTMPIHKVPCDLNEVVERLELRFGPVANHVNFNVSMEEQAAVVMGDALALEQALGNLIHNALKFASGHVAVVVQRSESAAQVWVDILDDGEGFDLGAQLGQPVGVSIHGLGLHIASSLIERHDAVLEQLEASGRTHLRVTFLEHVVS